MTVVLKLKVGNRTRTCGARCHRAKGLSCACICSGTYHGKNDAVGALMTQFQNGLINELQKQGKVTAQLPFDMSGIELKESGIVVEPEKETILQPRFL